MIGTLLLLGVCPVVHGAPKPRFHVGAALGPGYDAASWVKPAPNSGPTPTPEMWRRLGAALQLYAQANFSLFEGGPPLPATGPGQPGPSLGQNKTASDLETQATFLGLLADAGLEAMPGPDWAAGALTPAEDTTVWGYGLGGEQPSSFPLPSLPPPPTAPQTPLSLRR